MVNFVFRLLVFGINFYALNGKDPQNKSPYVLSEPDIIYKLPDTLREISGLALIDDKTFACVQDENGILFIYDLLHNQILEQHVFNIDGDYEGICRVNKTIYVLRSDGVLFEIENYASEKSKLNSYVTNIPSANNEGLCYDEKSNRLLIACKSNPGKNKALKDQRFIYAFDLNKKKLSDDPVFVFNVEQIKEVAEEMDLGLPTREKKDSEEIVLKFRPSAISIHPLDGKLYLLSAVDHLLFIFRADGYPESIIHLDAKLFNKAEGISFFPNGDMLITNEAQDRYPTLLLFRYRDLK